MALVSKDNRKSVFKGGVSFVALAAVVGEPTIALAQIDNIVVTARKREQNIQDLSLSVQAFDTTTIRQKGLRDFEDYAKELTSVSFGTSSPGATTIAFRGALAQPGGFDTISSSILYLDEVPITRDGQNPDVRLVDIERLEALNGPQPTLYGAGSQSGTLKIVTVKPDTSEFNGWVEAGASATPEGEPSYDISGAVNIPIVEDKLAIRLTGFRDEEGGYIDNILGTTSDYSPLNGTRSNAPLVQDDINDYSVYGGRATLRFEPNENWTADLGVTYQNAELDSFFDFNPAFGDLNTIKFKDEKRQDEWYNVSLTVQGDLGFADLTLASGYHSRDIDYNLDATAYMTAYKLNGLSLAEYYTGTAAFIDPATCTTGCYLFVNYNDFGADPTALISLDQRVRSFVQEVRLKSKDDSESRFSWLVGAFYERTRNDWDYITIVDDFAENGGGGSVFAYYGVAPSDVWFDQGFREGFTYNGFPGNDFNGQHQRVDSYAVFGEVGFEITDTLKIEAGGRWFTTDFRTAENSFFIGTNPSDNFDETENTKAFSPRVNLTWKPTDDILTYVTYSEGVRIGGTNGGASQNRAAAATIGAPETFDSDTLKNIEAGIKSTWADGRVIANLSAFTMDWEDYQIRVILPIAGASTVNAGNASIDGVEGQFAFKPLDGLELSTAFTYLNARIDDDIVLPGGSSAGSSGDKLPAVPEWAVAAGISYTRDLPWAGLEGSARFDVSHVGESVNATTASISQFGAGVSLPAVQEAYQIGDLSFGVSSEDNDWELSLSINNLWDERAVTYIQPRFSDDRVLTVRPRTFRLGLYKGF